jgi:hypothetical protein
MNVVAASADTVKTIAAGIRVPLPFAILAMVKPRASKTTTTGKWTTYMP